MSSALIPHVSFAQTPEEVERGRATEALVRPYIGDPADTNGLLFCSIANEPNHTQRAPRQGAQPGGTYLCGGIAPSDGNIPRYEGESARYRTGDRVKCAVAYDPIIAGNQYFCAITSSAGTRYFAGQELGRSGDTATVDPNGNVT